MAVAWWSKYSIDTREIGTEFEVYILCTRTFMNCGQFILEGWGGCNAPALQGGYKNT